MAVLVSQEIIRELFQLGHFSNPSMPTGVLRLVDLPKLTLASPEVQTAVKSYQSFMRPELERIYAMEKGHVNVAIDGEVGPLTAQLFTLDRCACPDYQAAEEVEAATGNGSWAHSCDPQRPGVHTIRVFIDKEGMPRSNTHPTVRMPNFLEPVFESKVWPLVVAAYRDVGVDFVRVDNWAECQIDFGWKIPSGYGSSTIGLAILPGSPQGCRSRGWGRLRETYNPNDLANQTARLTAHELGHILRLQHTTGGIMNPSILSGPFTKRAWRGDPSYGILARYFGGVPIDISNPEPPQPPGGEFDHIKATLVVNGQVYDLKPRSMS